MYTKYYAIESGTWSVNKENTTSMITLEKNDARMVRWSSHVCPGIQFLLWSLEIDCN